MTETVLVTGGTGFVAGWCIVELLERGYAVRTTIRNPAKEDAVRGATGGGDRLTFAIADLTDDDGWDQAVAGCGYVLHVASPLGGDGRSDDGTLTGPARDGALRVLRAATRARVNRVVMTSSTAAATPRTAFGVSDESVWTDPADPNLNPYRRSKLLAERAAWDFMASHPGGTTLTTILPTAIFGPLLPTQNVGSVEVIARLLAGRLPFVPRCGFTVVDVRDLADLHIRAMTSPAAAGQRFIGAGEFMWLSEIARTLRSQLGPARRQSTFPRHTGCCGTDAGPARTGVAPAHPAAGTPADVRLREGATRARVLPPPGHHDDHRLRRKPGRHPPRPSPPALTAVFAP
jgi:dihydroflavonol-4-reductase